jgi:hypothetical protein
LRAASERRLGDPGGALWPENVPGVQAFLAASTQWRTAPISGLAGGRVFWVGLDYAAARVAIEMHGLKLDARLMTDLQVMELAARSVLNGAEGDVT